MKILQLITVIFSVLSTIMLIIFSQGQNILNLYVAFVLLITTIQGVLGLLAPRRFKALILNRHLNISVLIIRIGLYIALARAFIIHGVEASTPLRLSMFGGISTALLIFLALSFLYTCRKAVFETVVGLTLLVLSFAAALLIGTLGYQETAFFTLDHTVPYLLAVYIIWALATFLSQFGKKSSNSLE